MVASRLKREVIAPDGPDRRDAVAAYRRRRKAVERARSARKHLYKKACDPRVLPDDLMDAVEELDMLIKVLEETL